MLQEFHQFRFRRRRQKIQDERRKQKEERRKNIPFFFDEECIGAMLESNRVPRECYQITHNPVAERLPQIQGSQ